MAGNKEFQLRRPSPVEPKIPFKAIQNKRPLNSELPVCRVEFFYLNSPASTSFMNFINPEK